MKSPPKGIHRLDREWMSDYNEEKDISEVLSDEN
jgi:hypothetical protein